jgi:lipopolysaccharide export system permease protein
LDTSLALNPEDFVRYVNQNDMTTTPELLRDIKKLELRGIGKTNSLETEFYRRTADPCTILILTIIGVALAARKVRGGMGLHLALGIGLGAVFIFISKFSVTFANMPNVPILLGIWIPNLIFGCLAIYLVTKAQR